MLLIRDIRPDDKVKLTEGLQNLSPETVFKRFLSAKDRFTREELRYLTEVDGHDHAALVALNRAGQIVAVARYVRDVEDPEAAEVAVVVADHLQGRGVGKRLGGMLADRARENGIRRFTATMLGENPAAHALLRSLSGRLVEHPPAWGVQELVAELAA